MSKLDPPDNDNNNDNDTEGKDTPEVTKPAPAIDIEAMTANMEAAIAQADDDANADDVAFVASLPLTYFNTKQGPFYAKAKLILQTGDFESALSKIETGLTTILSLLPTPDDLHESLAPLYYMYGTTLLYSVEESQDAEVTQQQGGGEDATGDLQIAWENLESASNILTQMTCEGAQEEERVLDLAQLHARLADLSRHDGHYEKAIRDYETSCESRRSCLVGDKVWDRRIADVEYNLGMTSLLLAAEGEKNLLDKDDGEADGQNAATAAMAAAADPEENEKVNLSPEEIAAMREKALRHYVQCARILAGIMATMTGVDPSEIAAADASLENNENKKCAANATGKTTGLDTNASVQEQASKALSAIRDRVSNLKPTDVEDADSLHDLSEMLDEIQETIDNCEQNSEALRDVNEMRRKAEDDIKNGDAMDAFAAANAADDESGGTTTFGFGSDSKPAASAAAATAAESTSFGFGSGATAAASGDDKPAAAPMMVVKKKKRAATQNSDSKRAKTE